MALLNAYHILSFQKFKFGLIIAVVAFVSACSTIDVSPPPKLEKDIKFGLLPFINHTETPQAGLKAESIAEVILRSNNINIDRYPSALNTETVFGPMERKHSDVSRKWAKNQGIRYALTGTIEEWRYKVGIDGEPAAGITLHLVDIQSDRIIWSATGGRTGWSREGLSSVGQKLMRDLLNPLVESLQ